MRIDKVDENFKEIAYTDTDDGRRYDVPCKFFDLYGVFYDSAAGRFMRMDAGVADRVSEGVSYLAKNTSGGRLRFSTNSGTIGISATYSSLCAMSHMPLTGSSGFILLEKTACGYKHVATFCPRYEDKTGYTGKVVLKTKTKREYVLYFPLYNDLMGLSVFLDKDAELYEPQKYRDIKPILYYGASIDQGACASRPDSTYPALISKWNDIDFINLCFSGNCKGEPLMAEYLTGIDCSLAFFAYDGNAPTEKFLEDTHYKFYETYRKVVKDVPVVFMSVPCYDCYTDYREADRRREIINGSCLKARKNGDNNVYFIDGKYLFDTEDREICTVEGVHPTDLGFYRIAKNVYKTLGEIDIKFL
ncbi:MAG: hypothetical protein J5903_00485 [Clostridia bacterium]|nr:hypothetical protein [Clostridia bacterium]